MTWQHFRDIHPMGLVKVPKEEKLHWYRRCEMQVDQIYAHHQYTKECQVGGRAEEAAGGRGNIGPGPLAAVLHSRRCFGVSEGIQIPRTPACAG